MNIITRRTLLYYINKYPLAATALKVWYDEFSKADFRNLNDLKRIYGSASIVTDKRIVFNIKGNSFRLIVSINFETKNLYLIWFGTNSGYDKIDVSEVRFISNPNK